MPVALLTRVRRRPVWHGSKRQLHCEDSSLRTVARCTGGVVVHVTISSVVRPLTLLMLGHSGIAAAAAAGAVEQVRA